MKIPLICPPKLFWNASILIRPEPPSTPAPFALIEPLPVKFRQTLQTQIQGATGDTLTQLQGSLATAMAQQTAMLAALPATAVSSLKSILNSQPGRAQGQSQAVYTDIIFDIEVDINHNGRTMKRMIKGCVLPGNSQTYDNNGNVLTDDYSFIARQVQ